jgi:hypothetical protein
MDLWSIKRDGLTRTQLLKALLAADQQLVLDLKQQLQFHVAVVVKAKPQA